MTEKFRNLSTQFKFWLLQLSRQVVNVFRHGKNVADVVVVVVAAGVVVVVVAVVVGSTEVCRKKLPKQKTSRERKFIWGNYSASVRCRPKFPP